MASRAPPGGATLGPSPAAVAVVDHSSYANPSEVRITHTDLEIDVDFESRTLRCWARHAVAVQAEGARALVLDSRGLALDSVSWDGGATQATHRAGPASAALGTPLHIALPPGAQPGSTLSLELRWATPPDAVAAQWLDPAQTAGGVKPFLFTQCQAIHARTLVPCQDTPGAKFTYEAAVKTPAGLVALMSALQVEGGGDGDDGGSRARCCLPDWRGLSLS
jgi:leukotriene-A4 hydrolase